MVIFQIICIWFYEDKRSWKLPRFWRTPDLHMPCTPLASFMVKLYDFEKLIACRWFAGRTCILYGRLENEVLGSILGKMYRLPDICSKRTSSLQSSDCVLCQLLIDISLLVGLLGFWKRYWEVLCWVQEYCKVFNALQSEKDPLDTILQIVQ